MGSLTTCIRKAGAALHAEDKRAILEAAAAYRAEGMGATEAARRAVDKRIAAVRAQLEARVREVERGAADVETEAPTAPTPKPHLFKTRAAAVAAKTGNMQRLRKVAGGYILRDASEAEMAAAERNGRRLAGPRAVDLERDSLLVAIAKLGGLSMAERADTVGEGNKNVAGRMLFARGGSLIDEIAADLRTLGYVPQTEMDRDGGTTWLRDAIRAEFNGLRESYSEAGTGWLEDAERERESRMRDPFEDVLDDFTPDELDDAGYTYAPPAVRHDVDALLAEAAALGIDSAAVREEAARITEDQSEDAYYAEVQRITREAIEAARADTARVDSAGSRAGDADRGAAVGEEGGAQEGLTLEAQTAASLAAKVAREARAGELDERAQIDAERAGFGLTQQAAPETRRDTTGDIFGGPSAAELQAAAERERAKTATGPSGPDLFSEPAEDAAQPPAATETEEGEGRQERAGSAKPSGRIDDFGEKLEGARKDYAATLKDAQDMDVAAEPLSKSWPEPDYQKLLDGGADPRAVATIRALRDEVPTKPQTAWKLRGWVDLVKGLRRSATIIVDGTVPAARATELLAKRGETGANIIGRAELYEAIGHDRSLRGVSLRRHHFSLYHGQENVSKWVVEQKAKATAFSNWPRELAVADTKDEALRIFKEKVGSLDLGTKAKGQPQFVIYRKRGQEGAFIGKKIGREFIDLHRAADVAAARAYMASNLADLERALALYRSTPFERRPDNQPRVGDDHRNGAPVTPEVFDETFGFRGVQFGNYVEQGRRQSDLNEAYDALMDMAAILGLPPRALSLNGQLGLAFGARGTGGKDAPGATYDPDFVVINLTKGGGPGALAHEWWHGVDNYFAKLGGANGSVTGGAQASAMREAMRRAFAAVKAATSTPAYKQRAIELDKRRSRPYWSAADERSARAFESYIIAKLQDQGASNDYLANVVSEQFWNASEALRAGLFSEGKQPNTYPYPLPAEMPAVRAAFDEFFKTVETRTDDTGNVAMFSRVPSSAAEVRAAREAIARIERAGGVTSPDDLAAVLRVSGYSQWAESPIAGDVDAAAALRADLDARFPRGDWKRPILNDQGVISVTGEWLRDTLLRDDPKAADDLAALADKHSAPIIVRGHLSSSVGEVASFLERFLRPAGFEDYAGHQEMDGRPARVAITYIRPKGNISRVTPLYSRATPAGRMTTETKAFRDWFGDSVITKDGKPGGEPLVVYHGTAADFVVFESRAQAAVYRVNDEEVQAANSWDMGEGGLGMPDGYHYQAIGDAVHLGPAEALRIRQADADRLGGDHPDTKRLLRDLRRLQGKKVTRTTEVRPSGDAFYFTADPAYSFVRDIGRINGGNVMPVYLSIKNPIYLNASAIESAGASFNVEKYKAQGYDGAIFADYPNDLTRRGWNGSAQIVAFYPEQIKSAIGNRGTFDPRNPDIRFGRSRAAGRMTHEAATDLAAAIAATWANAPKVQVVRDMQDPAIPANVRAEDARQRRSGAIGQPNGFYYGGTVYVVSSQISSAQELATVLFHEALGHAGLRGVFGAALKPVLKQLVALNRPAVEAKAKQYGLDMGKEQDRLIAAEEVLTGLAQTRPESTWVQKAIAAIRGWLRENLPAIFGDMQMSDAELVQRFIVPARDFIERGRADAQGDVAPVFSRAEATPLWYSELASQVQAAAMKAAPASGWRAWLKGLPQKGVRPDEIEWSGLPEWLDLQDGKVTREQVAEYLRANGVQVTETVLGAPLSSSEAGLAARKAVFDEYAPRINPLHERAGDFRITPEERAAARAEAERLMEQRDAEADRAYRLPADETSPANYDRYTLPGGTNYREVLLTLPERLDAKTLERLDQIEEELLPLSKQYARLQKDAFSNPLISQEESDAAAAQMAAVSKTMNALEDERERLKAAAKPYQTRHWDQPNVLAHIRLNDRTDADGKRVLFVEEIQSDWGQAGKKARDEQVRALAKKLGIPEEEADKQVPRMAGFRDPTEEAAQQAAVAARKRGAAEVLRLAEMATEAWRKADPVRRGYMPSMHSPEQFRHWLPDPERAMLATAIAQARTEIPDVRGSVPNAPFVGATDKWLTLALKRVIKLAVDEGYDRVAFVTGEQSADRYDLSKQVESIKYVQRDGKYRVEVYPKGGSGWTSAGMPHWMSADELSNYVGKEIAQKITDGQGDTSGPGQSTRFLHGLDLKVGGEGMRAFYDKIVPSVLKDVLKKVGGGALTPVQFGSAARYRVVDVGDGDWVIAVNGVPRWTGYASKADAEQDMAIYQRRGIGAEEDGPRKQPGFTITPAMREKAAGGMPMFSRAQQADAGKLAAQDLLNASGGIFDFNRLGATRQDRIRTIIDRTRKFWLGALTRDQIADVYGDELPPVRDYDDLSRSMENERQKRAQDADKLYNEWAQLDEATNDAIGRIILDATVFQVHPDQADPPRTADAKARLVHSRIRREFEALPQQARDIYAKVSAFHQGTLRDLRAAVEGRIERQVESGQAKAAALTKIRAMFDQHLRGGPYFPLSRFGDYLVIANRESDGERVVAAYETSGEQQAAARTLKADGFTVKTTVASAYSREIDGAAGKFIGDVMAAVEKLDMVEATVNGSRSDLKNQLLDDLNQMFIRALPDLSYRKHFLHRKNTPGFSVDVMRGFASSAFHAASHIARLNHGDRMTFALSDAYQAIKLAPEGDFGKYVQVLNELSARHDAALNPNTHPIAAILNQVGFVMYLGLSPAAGLVNLLQTPMVTLPYLGARYSFGKASAALGRAAKDITAAPMNKQSGWDATQSPKLSAAERTAMAQLHDEGIIDLTQAHDLAAASGLDTGNVARSKAAFAMARAMKIVGWTFHVPEVMNRQTTALAAYRLEMAASGDAAKATNAAREAITRTHFDYSASNRARYLSGNLARVVFQFKQYAQNMTYLLARAAQQALSGETPEVRRIARRQLAATVGATWVMAGTLGLPGLGAVMGAIGAVVGALGDDDEPWDWEVELRNLLADEFGAEVGEILAHGLPRALMPWDISSRVGMGDLWFRSGGREGQSPREAYATDIANILGPTAATLLGWYTAADHMQRGAHSKAVEAIVPKAIRDPLKAYREASEGVTTYAGEPVMETTAAETLGRALGFAPARSLEMYEAQGAVMNAKTAIEQKRNILLARLTKARLARDRDAEQDARDDIAAFNKSNPQQAITADSIRRSLRTRQRNRENRDRGILLPGSQEYLRERGRFAAAS